MGSTPAEGMVGVDITIIIGAGPLAVHLLGSTVPAAVTAERELCVFVFS